MTIDKMKSLKKGDKVVKVRSHYQNYDFTMVPCEPKVYTVSSKTMDINLKESVKRSFLRDGTRYVNANGCDRRDMCESFETLEDYLAGNYNKDIILDKIKWPSLEEFLLFKMGNDHNKAKEVEAKRINDGA